MKVTEQGLKRIKIDLLRIEEAVKGYFPRVISVKLTNTVSTYYFTVYIAGGMRINKIYSIEQLSYLRTKRNWSINDYIVMNICNSLKAGGEEPRIN